MALDYQAWAAETLRQTIGAKSKTDEELDRIATWPQDREDTYNEVENYYNGKQRTLLTDRLKEWLQRSKIEYCENYVEAVVDAQVNRLAVIGVSTDLDDDESEPGPDGKIESKEDLGSWLWTRVWDGTQGDEKSGDLFQQATLLGDSFLIVDYDAKKDKPRWTINDPRVCRVEYDGEEKLYAVKKWYTQEKGPSNPTGLSICRLNIYYPDRIEKWFKLDSQATTDNKAEVHGWVEWIDDTDAPVWPTPWTYDDGGEAKPLGIPVFHFANRRRPDRYGRSEAASVIPQQDRLNKELLDLAAISDTMGAPQRWAVGLDGTTGLTSNPGEVWSAPDPAAKFGQFEAAPLEGPLKAIQSTILRISTRSATPAYLLYLEGGNMPSGEALKTADAGLVSKVRRLHPAYGNQLGEAFRLSALLALVFGADNKPPVTTEELDTCTVSVQWRDPETHNELQHLQTLALWQALGIPDELIWAQIEGLDVEKAKELKAQSDLKNADMLANQFNRGGDANPADPGQTGQMPMSSNDMIAQMQLKPGPRVPDLGKLPMGGQPS